MTYPSDNEWIFPSLEVTKFTRNKPKDFIGLIFRELTIQNFRIYWKSMSEMFIPTSLWESTKHLEYQIFDALPLEDLHGMMKNTYCNENLIEPFNIFLSLIINTRGSALEEAQKHIRPRIKIDILMTKLYANIFPSIIHDVTSLTELLQTIMISKDLKGYRPYRKPEIRECRNNQKINRKKRLLTRDWLFFVIWSLRIKRLYKNIGNLKSEKYYELKRRLKLRKKYNIKSNVEADKNVKNGFATKKSFNESQHNGLDPLEDYIKYYRKKRKMDEERDRLESEKKLSLIWGLEVTYKCQELSMNLFGTKNGVFDIGSSLKPGFQLQICNICSNFKILQFHKEIILLCNEINLYAFIRNLKEVHDNLLQQIEKENVAPRSLISSHSPNFQPSSQENKDNLYNIRPLESQPRQEIPTARNIGIFDFLKEKIFGIQQRPQPIIQPIYIPQPAVQPIQINQKSEEKTKNILVQSEMKIFQSPMDNSRFIPFNNSESSFNMAFFGNPSSNAQIVENDPSKSIWQRIIVSLKSSNNIPAFKLRVGSQFLPNSLPLNEQIINLKYFIFFEMNSIHVDLFPKIIEEFCKIFVEYRELPGLRDILCLGRLSIPYRLPVMYSMIQGKNKEIEEIDNARIYIKDDPVNQENVANEEGGHHFSANELAERKVEYQNAISNELGELFFHYIKSIDKIIKKNNFNIKFKIAETYFRFLEDSEKNNEVCVKKIPYLSMKIPTLFGQFRKENSLILANLLGFSIMTSKSSIDLSYTLVKLKQLVCQNISNDFLKRYYEIYNKIHEAHLISQINKKKPVISKPVSSINVIEHNDVAKNEENKMNPKKLISSNNILQEEIEFKNNSNALIFSQKESIKPVKPSTLNDDQIKMSKSKEFAGRIYQMEERSKQFIESNKIKDIILPRGNFDKVYEGEHFMQKFKK